MIKYIESQSSHANYSTFTYKLAIRPFYENPCTYIHPSFYSLSTNEPCTKSDSMMDTHVRYSEFGHTWHKFWYFMCVKHSINNSNSV